MYIKPGWEDLPGNVVLEGSLTNRLSIPKAGPDWGATTAPKH